MSKWRIRGYVQDSDEEEEEELETQSPSSSGRAEERFVPASLPSSTTRNEHNVGEHASQDCETLDDEKKVRDALEESVQLEEAGTLLRPTTPSSDDDLSDPPSSPEPIAETIVVFAEPTRHAGVLIDVPQSTNIEKEHVVQRANRELRTRKPIQLHPYLLEGERYKREFHSRGIKPVARARSRSPTRRVSHVDVETQEEEFDPENDSSLDNDAVVPTPTSRKRRKDGLHGNSAHRPSFASGTQTFITSPSFQCHPHSAKRRKLIRPSTQIPATSRRPTVNENTTKMNVDVERSRVQDLWTIPRSPPYSSSPHIEGEASVLGGRTRLPGIEALPDLPTPTHSSSLRGGFPLLVNTDSEPESDSQTSKQPALQPHPRVFIPSDESSSGEAEVELQRIGKRLKEQQAREKRKAQAEVRERTPERAGLQRGVAQKVVRRGGKLPPTLSSNKQPKDVILVSDESDIEHMSVYSHTEDIRASVRKASELAARFDHRYADDSDNMEYDRVDLGRVPGPSRKRKRQLKMTDAFGQSRQSLEPFGKQPKTSSGSKRTYTVTNRLPALSILDIDQSSPKPNQTVPQFIKLATRQARRAPDLGRQSPKNKHIRLHTARDTKDARRTLEQWRNGILKPNVRLAQVTQHKGRQPLADRTNLDHQAAQMPLPAEKRSAPGQGMASEVVTPPAKIRRHQTLPHGLAIFRRLDDVSTERVQTPTQRSSLKRKFPQPIHRNLLSFRAAQLEGLQSDFGRNDRQIAFQRGLQRVDQQFTFDRLQPARNPQLAKFLADDGSVLPPLPSAGDIGEQEAEPTVKNAVISKRRLIRKSQARRIDVDAREYRQPSEPTLQDLFQDFAIEEFSQPSKFLSPLKYNQSVVLQGLGPHGTRYPTDFDVMPLAVGTYFHSSTFIGSEELSQALQTGKVGSRDLETSAGRHRLIHNQVTVLCGSWKDETFSQIQQLLERACNFSDLPTLDSDHVRPTTSAGLSHVSNMLRSLINYFATNLSFDDTIDRRDFTMKMQLLLQALFDKVFQFHLSYDSEKPSISQGDHQSVRTMTYLLVLSVQVCQIAQSYVVDASIQSSLTDLITNISKIVVTHLENKRYKARENGIQDDQILVESLVVCQQVLTTTNITGPTFWDLTATHVKTFESVWASLFTLLPFIEFDPSGILAVNRRATLDDGNWTFIKTLLNRLFDLYSGTFKTHSSSFNEYIRTNLTRCHILLQYWHWQRCEPMLYTVFTYFGKIGLRQLQREPSKGSPHFLGCLAELPSLSLEPALGIRGMQDVYTEKKMRTIDQPLDQETLDALRNHHDLLCTLYWASPPSCRPKLNSIRILADHEHSHREACRLNVRAWPYESLQPFALWHKEIMEQTLKQYKLAKTEAEDYFKAVQLDGTTDISVQMQVIATLRDCITGMQKAMKHSTSSAAVRSFLIDSGVVQLLELVQVDDPRLIVVIRETLAVLREYTLVSEESQDYGDFPDLDDLEEATQQIPRPDQRSLDFIQIPLWHLLSNAFGAESVPDDSFLMECVETWALIAGSQVLSGERSWSYYVDPYSQVSWSQLRDTDQTRKFRPYFMASLITCDATAYTENRDEFLTSLLLCLADRDSMLRFQHCLLKAIVQVDSSHPMLNDLPFFRDERTGEFDITADTLRTRRLALISSILANMRADFQASFHNFPDRTLEIKRGYATILKAFMNAMKNNYQQLRQGAGTYVAFVQKIVQFLKQYTPDICAVLGFFTDSVGFPLPAADPTYVVGRLCGYAPKLANLGAAKQLATFMQTVSQQATSDNQQEYLVKQLVAALSGTETVSVDAVVLRNVLLQGIFPAYIEASFSSTIGSVIASPILETLKKVLEAMFFDLRVMNDENVECILNNIASISYAFIRSTKRLKTSPELLNRPHILHTFTLMLNAVTVILPIMEYIQASASRSSGKPAIVAYIEELSIFVTEVMHNEIPHAIPISPFLSSSPGPHTELLAFSTKDLAVSMKTNWREDQGRIFFIQNHARREVRLDLGTMEQERCQAEGAIGRFHAALGWVYGERERGLAVDVFV
ncbi:hypothetical protein K504DRAFT_482702 [Pleomassaria siparia CBS 279.74]|uniref:Mus7/MMS22 family-domain-containing protein n=1 Tax=Pleomassaria siparia CBS 279.74 TaxID=1314801 RepID=A0A6G1K620_9PLEO|nr:hypothetical protein K504DRAFT_482702 [Pleomassaria siparia CBS 279.74]